MSLLLIIIFFSCASKPEDNEAKITYPDPHPDSVALTFLPGIVSSESRDLNAMFSPDGQSFFFTRAQNDRMSIYQMRLVNGAWNAPEPFPYTASDYSDADPAIAPDGKLYFISTRPKDENDKTTDYDIWSIAPQVDGSWSKPENVAAVNSDSSEYYVSFSNNGNIYFSSSRAGGFGQEDIYRSRFENGSFTPPENLGGKINSGKSEYDPGISMDENMLVFTSSGRDDSFGAGDLYGSKLDRLNTWMQARNLGKRFNTPTRDYCASFTPDSKYFFFSSEDNVKWISRKVLEDELK